MAQRQHVTFVSDLSGKEITDNDQPTVKFGLDGRIYSIDLSNKEQEKFRDLLAPYIEAGKSEGRATKRAAASSSPSESAAIRAWAAYAGHDVPKRGRLPRAVRDEWEALGKPGAGQH